jgi:hypothetical protein
MSDITKCADATCPKNNVCYRYIAPYNEFWQSYFAESPRHGDECDEFWLDKLALDKEIVDMTKDKAVNLVESLGLICRTSAHGRASVSGADFRSDRVNLKIKGGLVKSSSVG